MSIPKDWRICRIDELSHYITSGSRGWAQYYSDSGDLFVRITNLTREKLSLDLSNSKYVNIPEDSNEGKRTRLMRDDILISITADLGITGFIGDEANKPAYINQHIALLRISEEKIHNKFVAYQMASKSGHEQFLSLNDAGAKSGLNLDSIRRFQITIPPLREQCRIAEILGVWDESIDLLEKLIAVKRKLKQGLMQKLLTGKKRFKEFKHFEWNTKTLDFFVEKIVGGGTPSRENSDFWGDEIPWATVKDFTSFNPFKTQEFITKEGLVNSSSNLIPKDTVIIPTRMALGKAVIYKVDVSINQDLKAIFPKKDLNSIYLYHWLQSQAKHIAKISSGSTVKGILLSDLKSMVFSKPSLPEQEKIAAVLSAADAEISTLEKQLAAYKQQKCGLMQQLLTGRTRILGLEDGQD
jgi:type I restriction enzyme, S subunit